MAEKKYYWLKLKRDFFKRHDIRIIEELPNGKEYLLFYLKLLVESIDHEGALRFSDTVPYNEQMLSVITNTNIDVVRSAMKLFIELNMMDVLDDATIYMKEVNTMIGSETRWAEKKRVQRQRDNVHLLSPKCPTEKEIEKEKDTEIDKEKDNKPPQRSAKPSIDEVKAYCAERGNNVDAEAWYDFYKSKGWKVGKNPMVDWKAAVRTWERRSGKSERNRRDDFEPYPDEY
jgi:predicted phage replisome organizer